MPLVASARTTAQQEKARAARLEYFDSVPSKRLHVSTCAGSAKEEQAPSHAALTPGEPKTERQRRLLRLDTKLQSFKPESDCRSNSIESDEDELQAALALSLQPLEAHPPAPVASNSLWAPPRYVPVSSTESADKTLRLIERVRVRDGGFSWQPATAFLDTGNQHMTIVDSAFAARHALYRPADQGPMGVFSQAERWTTLHGVVPGASSRAPVVTIALDVRGHNFTIQAAVSEMRGHDLLLGIDVLQLLFAAGFNISAGSV